MEQEESRHTVNLIHRTQMRLSGIEKVISLEPELVELETAAERLSIKGHELSAEKLDMEKGELHLTGIVQGMLYSEKKGRKKAASFAKRLFR